MVIGPMKAVGIWFYSLDTRRYLYLLRHDSRNPETWGLPGGKVDADETLLQALERECHEEIGQFPEYVRMMPLEQFTSADGAFIYHTFFCCVPTEFRPVLNDEHLGYAWIDSMTWPKPMHPGLWNTINFDAIKSKIETIKATIHTSQ